MLTNDAVPLDTKETIAAAVREELDRRQLAASEFVAQPRSAGHSVDVLLKVYAKCIEGQEATVNGRVDQALTGVAWPV